MQEEFAATIPPEILIFPLPAVAVTVPPQVLLSPLGVATTKPAGKLSVKATPTSGVDGLGLVIVNVRPTDELGGCSKS